MSQRAAHGDSVVVYAGRTDAGGVRRQPNGFEARDADGRKVGFIATRRHAADDTHALRVVDDWEQVALGLAGLSDV